MNSKVSLTIAVIFVGSFGMYLFATIGPLGQHLAKKNAIVEVESPWERDVMADHDTQAREGERNARVEPDEALRAVQQAQREEVASERRRREAQRRLRAAIKRSEQILEEERAQQEGAQATTGSNLIETIKNGEDVVFETLTRQMVIGVIMEQRDVVERCAQESNPENYQGIANIRFVVEKDGSVSEATVADGPKEQEVSKCVIEAVESFQFPATLEGGNVAFPFVI